jgi:hypothetical protein
MQKQVEVSKMSTDVPSEDRRRFPRVGFQANALLKVADRTIAAEIVDISLAGAMLDTVPADGLEDGIEVSLNVELGRDVEFEMTGALIAHGDGSFALRLVEDDHHLRRLLELNLGDSDLMERDIEALVKDQNRIGYE